MKGLGETSGLGIEISWISAKILSGVGKYTRMQNNKMKKEEDKCH